MTTSPQDITVFAETNFRHQRRRFGIKIDDRRRHMYLIGKTGMGKSTLIENMVIADIRAGRGVAVVDPHGDLVEKIIKFIPPERINDVIYFNPSDTQYPIAFNILESIDPEYKHLIAYGLVGVFKKIWADSWGPRMEYILTNSILALLDYPGSTLLGIMRLLVDKKYRKKVISRVTDPVVKTFWTDEYANYSEKFRTEAIAPIQNKVGQFLASSIIRNIVGQSKSTIEMRKVIDDGKIILMNFSKGRIGEENSRLLGAMMVTKLQLAAMSRVDIPEIERKDFFLYVDEFQNFATESFANILSEARKYRLNLILAHQYIEQLDDLVKAAVFGNVGTLICFRVGAADGLILEPEFTPRFLAQDLVNIPKYNFYLKLMIDGVAADPFSAKGLPPAKGEMQEPEKVVRISRERYAHPKKVVEERILRWSGVEVAESPEDKDAREQMEKEKEAEAAEATEESDEIPIQKSVTAKANIISSPDASISVQLEPMDEKEEENISQPQVTERPQQPQIAHRPQIAPSFVPKKNHQENNQPEPIKNNFPANNNPHINQPNQSQPAKPMQQTMPQGGFPGHKKKKKKKRFDQFGNPIIPFNNQSKTQPQPVGQPASNQHPISLSEMSKKTISFIPKKNNNVQQQNQTPNFRINQNNGQLPQKPNLPQNKSNTSVSLDQFI